MKRIVLIIAIFISILDTLQAQDINFRYSKLKNGLTYYIRHTKMQKGKADFYLVQNVGALMENDKQNGLAHILEHMAFEATDNFPNGIPNFLTKNGISNFNAYTGQDETVYHIENVPTKSITIVDSCILALRDWSGFLKLKSRQIEKQRQIVIEERRQGRHLKKRMESEVSDIIYNGSKYATHDVIGTTEVLNSFRRRDLRKFYKDFYRPDQQAIIIVGDVDVDYIEQNICKLFGKIPKRTNPKPRVVYGINDNIEPLYAKVFNKNTPGYAMALMKRHKLSKYSNMYELAYYNLIKLFYNNIVSEYLQNYVSEFKPDFLIASINMRNLVRGYDALNIFVRAFPGKEKAALLQLMTELERIHKYGINDNSLQIQINKYLSGLEDTDKYKNNLENRVYVEIYKNNFLLGNPITSVEEDISASREVLKKLKVEDIKSWISSWWDNYKNWVFIMQGKDSEYNYPSKDEIFSIIKKSKTLKLKNYKESIAKAPDVLIDFKIEEGKILDKKDIKPLGAEMWKLSNGATVYYKLSKDKARKFGIWCESKGGKSLVEAGELPSADMISDMFLEDGIYKYNKRELNELFKRDKAALHIIFTDLSEGFVAMGDIKKKAIPFELLYLAFEKNKFSREKFDKLLFARKMDYEMSPKTVIDTIQNAMRDFINIKSERLWEQNKLYLNSIDFDIMSNIYDERFVDASDFTFYIVGDIPVADAEILTSKYIASLPSLHRNETYMEYQYHRKDSETKDIEINIPDNKYIIQMEFSNDIDISPQESLEMDILSILLKSKLTYEIRERNSGTYNVYLQANTVDYPSKLQTLRIRFESSTDKGPYMRNIVYSEIKKIVDGNIDEEELEDILMMMQRKRKNMIKSIGTSFWVRALKYYNDRGKYLNSSEYFEDVVDNIDAVTIKNFAKKFFMNPVVFDLVLKSKN